MSMFVLASQGQARDAKGKGGKRESLGMRMFASTANIRKDRQLTLLTWTSHGGLPAPSTTRLRRSSSPAPLGSSSFDFD